VILHPAADGLQVELVPMVELGRHGKQAALGKEAACLEKVVAGAPFGRCFPLTSARELERTMSVGSW
jgi:hypothetical protein